jgi:hypothetical protein
MCKRIVEVTLPTTGKSHTRIESWGGDGYYDRYWQFESRRVVCEGQDEAQIEVMVVQTVTGSTGKKRTTTIAGSIILSPEEARVLALSICPELAPK